MLTITEVNVSSFRPSAAGGTRGLPHVVSGAASSRVVASGCVRRMREMGEVLDQGPFFHGTRAELRTGDLLTAGYRSNYRPEVIMNHIYFTALPDGAGLAAEVAALDGIPHVYEVEPTGPFENDPNVTDKKFPGNPTRSYRSAAPLRIIREVSDWTRLTPEALQGWRDRLSAIRDSGAEIIN